jgi:hypothetical protein
MSKCVSECIVENKNIIVSFVGKQFLIINKNNFYSTFTFFLSFKTLIIYIYIYIYIRDTSLIFKIIHRLALTFVRKENNW